HRPLSSAQGAALEGRRQCGGDDEPQTEPKMKSPTKGFFLLFLMLAPHASAQPATKGLSSEVRDAWEKAGAESGWTGRTWYGLTFRAGAANGEAGELPAFGWPHGKPGVLAQLPAPQQAFGLDLRGPDTTDAVLKELRRFSQLRSLILDTAPVTDAGLKELV